MKSNEQIIELILERFRPFNSSLIREMNSNGSYNIVVEVAVETTFRSSSCLKEEALFN